MTCKCANKYTVQTTRLIEVNADEVCVPEVSYHPLTFLLNGKEVASFSDWQWFAKDDCHD